MDIIACPAPDGASDGSLEPAPLSSLLPTDGAAAWRAFWGMDDRYYACLRTADGVERWFRIAEAGPNDRRTPGGGLPAVPPRLSAGGSWGAESSGSRRGARVVFAVRAGARGRGVTSLAARAGRSRRPQP